VQSMHRFISSLYCQGASVPPERFRRWALQELRSLIPFDAAVWGSGTLKRDQFHNVTVDGRPSGFAEALQQTSHENPLFTQIKKNWGKPVAMSDVLPDRKFFKSELYQRTFEPYGVERILSSANVEPRSGLYTLLSIYREDRKKNFTAQEKLIQEPVLHHLIQAASHAFFLAISRPKVDARTEWNAVCDSTGVFHEVETPFMNMLEVAYPNWGGQCVPFELPAAGFSGALASGLCLRAETFGDLFLLRLREAGPLDDLTERERSVVIQVCEGLSAKAIGRNLDLAPSTVSTHLYRAYRKLGVESRTNLAKLVKSLRG
jgi:DNA-binding CsgD family transcriptional regulator